MTDQASQDIVEKSEDVPAGVRPEFPQIGCVNKGDFIFTSREVEILEAFADYHKLTTVWPAILEASKFGLKAFCDLGVSDAYRDELNYPFWGVR